MQHLWARLQREESVNHPAMLPEQGRVPRKKTCSFLLILLGLTGFKVVVIADPNISPHACMAATLPAKPSPISPSAFKRVYIYVE